MWLVFTLISVFSIAISNLLQRVLMKGDKTNPFTYTAIFQTLVGVCFGVIALFKGVDFASFDVLWLNIAFCIVIYAFSNVFLSYGFKNFDASTVSIIFTTSTVWSVLGSILFLGESLELIHFLGIGLIILGVILVNYCKGKAGFKFDKKLIFPILASVGFGIAFVNDAYVLQNGADVVSYSFFTFILTGVFTFLIYPKSIKFIGLFKDSKLMSKILLLSVVYSLGVFAVYSAYNQGKEISIVTAVSKLTTIVTVILAFAFLKERDRVWQKVIGSIVAVGGVIILSVV